MVSFFRGHLTFNSRHGMKSHELKFRHWSLTYSSKIIIVIATTMGTSIYWASHARSSARQLMHAVRWNPSNYTMAQKIFLASFCQQGDWDSKEWYWVSAESFVPRSVPRVLATIFPFQSHIPFGFTTTSPIHVFFLGLDLDRERDSKWDLGQVT